MPLYGVATWNGCVHLKLDQYGVGRFEERLEKGCVYELR
jgi:hypothetical protein